jgi:hypothetical protein
LSLFFTLDNLQTAFYNWLVMTPTITTFAWVPPFARGFVRDIRARWAFEEVGQPYAVELIADAKSPDHRRLCGAGRRPAGVSQSHGGPHGDVRPRRQRMSGAMEAIT